MAFKIHFNDDVCILSGKDKGKIGKVKLVLKKKHRVIVEGVNFVKKHQKAVPSKNQNSAIIKREASIHISNVAVVNPITKKPDRVGFKIKNKKKFRFLKSNNKIIK